MLGQPRVEQILLAEAKLVVRPAAVQRRRRELVEQRRRVRQVARASRVYVFVTRLALSQIGEFWHDDLSDITYKYPNRMLLPEGTPASPTPQPISVCSVAWEWLWNTSHSRRVG